MRIGNYSSGISVQRCLLVISIFFGLSAKSNPIFHDSLIVGDLTYELRDTIDIRALPNFDETIFENYPASLENRFPKMSGTGYYCVLKLLDDSLIIDHLFIFYTQKTILDSLNSRIKNKKIPITDTLFGDGGQVIRSNDIRLDYVYQFECVLEVNNGTLTAKKLYSNVIRDSTKLCRSDLSCFERNMENIFSMGIKNNFLNRKTCLVSLHIDAAGNIDRFVYVNGSRKLFDQLKSSISPNTQWELRLANGEPIGELFSLKISSKRKKVSIHAQYVDSL